MIWPAGLLQPDDPRALMVAEDTWNNINMSFTGEAQPQLWHHALFYMAAMEAYGPDR